MDKTCSVCGLPMGIGRGNRWLPNGVITASHPPHIRGTLYDVQELGLLFKGFSERVGFDISRLVLEGKRKDGKRFCDSMLRRIREAGGVPPTPQQVYQTICRFCLYWGLGRVQVADYRRGRSLELEAENLYNVPMFMGDVAGIFEGMEGKRGKVSWRGDDRDGVVTVEATREEPYLEERVSSEVERGVPCRGEGDLHYRRCPGCGVPEAVGRDLAWDLSSGTIHEKETGKRYILHNTNGIVAVVRVLQDELGPEPGPMMAEIVRGLSRLHYLAFTGSSSVDAELMRFPARGWGRPVRLKMGEGGGSVRVVNPYCSPMVAGRVWGMLEAFESREMELVSMQEEEGILQLELRFPPA